jgi:hypothetical protein
MMNQHTKSNLIWFDHPNYSWGIDDLFLDDIPFLTSLLFLFFLILELDPVLPQGELPNDNAYSCMI